MNTPRTARAQQRRAALAALEALRELIEDGGDVLLDVRPPRGVYPTADPEIYRRCVTFQVNAQDYDSRFRANG